MSNVIDPTGPNFLNDRVFRGFWRRYGPEGSSDLLLTLSFYQALIILAVLVLAVEYGGSRAWVIIRFAISKIVSKPVRLEDQMPDRLSRISRGRALMNTFVPIQELSRRVPRLMRYLGSSVDTEYRHDPGQSRWYGIASLSNIILFIFLGVALPILLSEGTLNPPIVKSKAILGGCQADDSTLMKALSLLQYTSIVKESNSVSAMCRNSSESCFETYGFMVPRIEKHRLDTCPFPGPICDNSTKAFEITHLNITSYELGSNSPSKLTFSHRTTCAPVDVDEFTLWSSDYSQATISAHTTLGEPPFNHSIVENFSLALKTANGPNIVSKNLSGLYAARQNVPPAVHVLPTVDGTLYMDEKFEGWDHVHQYIQREDGHSFLIVNVAGRVSYDAPLNDSFFSAHTTLDGFVLWTNDTLYLPDREATTMACVDQYEFCIPGNGFEDPYCSGWGNGEIILLEIFALFMRKFNIAYHDDKQLEEGMASVLKSPEGRSIVMDAVTTLPPAIETLSLHLSMAMRNRMIPASALLRDQFSPIRLGYTDDQWTVEIETWFTQAILDTLLRIKGGASTAIGNHIPSYLVKTIGANIENEWQTCGRVLFRNAGSTNIDVIGFCAVLTAIIFISVVSYDLEGIYDATVSAVHSRRNFRDLMTSIRFNTGDLTTFSWSRLRLLRSAPWIFQSSMWISLILSQLKGDSSHRANWSSRRPQRMSSTDQEAREDAAVESETDVENIRMDDLDNSNLQRGEEIDDPL